MKTVSKFKTGLLAIAAIFVINACNRNGDDAPEGQTQDPLIGYWKLRAVTANSQTVDVTNQTCWKDSYMNVDAKMAKLSLTVPENGKCTTSADNYPWSNNNGTYYYTENGQQIKMPVTLLDNNTTLQLNISDGQSTVIFSFRK